MRSTADMKGVVD